MTRRCILLMVKNPEPGSVKTRLGAEIGMIAAADAYRALTEAVVARLPTDVSLRICFAPDDSVAAIRRWLEPRATRDATFHPQGTGSLGERMNRAFDTAFAAGDERVAVIGSDCIDITPADFAEAFDALEQHPAALGPSTDGGYYLLALRAPAPHLFAGVEWSTERVLGQTIERIRELGWTHHTLSAKTDVDTRSEWEIAREALAVAADGPM